jgi:hypothetical protein
MAHTGESSSQRPQAQQIPKEVNNDNPRHRNGRYRITPV